MHPPAHPSDRSGHTRHKTGTSVPAWLCGPASASCFLMNLKLHPTRRTVRFHLASRGRIGFTCVTAHRFAARGFARKIALPCARLATCRICNYKVNSFQFTRSDRLLGAPNLRESTRNLKKARGLGKRLLSLLDSCSF